MKLNDFDSGFAQGSHSFCNMARVNQASIGYQQRPAEV
jgi:hypothetical protein